MSDRQTSFGTCSLCEAACGLEVEHDGEKPLRILGDAQDQASRGFICPKGVALIDLHTDPDRLRQPMKRVGDSFEPVSWEDAFREIGARLADVQSRHGRDSVAVYRGNPVGHSYAGTLFQLVLDALLGTKQRYSAASVDALPRQLCSYLMYGNQAVLAVPDLDRTDYLLVLGANPMVSNGSVMTAPDPKRRLRALRERGGTLVVVDPRRTETAELADRHVFIRPGTDVYFLLGMLQTLFAEELIDLGNLSAQVRGLDAVREAVRDYPPERVESVTGIPAADIVTIAREFAAAPTAVCYGRMGTSTQEFGSLASWLVELMNIVTGNLDRPGGVLFNTPAVDLPAVAARLGKAGSYASYRTRVGGLPEFAGEFPVAALADEMETEGPGQIRALITHAGNPSLSLPNGKRLDRAFESLEFMVSIDLYVNETTRHADFILPSSFGFERDDYQILACALGVRNRARYVPAFLKAPSGVLHDWRILLGISEQLLQARGQRVFARSLALLERIGPRGMLSLFVRFGPHGAGLSGADGLTLERLAQLEHGVELGPLEPRLASVLATPSGRVELAPQQLLADLSRAAARLDELAQPSGFLLIGRRTLRSNNSWMHNSRRLVKGRPRCTLLLHPEDAAEIGVRTGQDVRVRSRVGSLVAPVEVSDEVMRGVASLPHGWGHARTGSSLGVAEAHPGVSLNDITDDRLTDELSGTTNFNGLPVEISAEGLESGAAAE